MSTARKVAHNTIIQFAGKAISTVFALICVSLVLRYLGQSGFGEYSIIIGFLSIFSILADLGLYLVVTKEISRPGANEEKIVSNAFTIKLFAGILILTLAPIVSLIFPYSRMVKIGMIIGSFSFLFILLNQTLIGIFQKYFRMDKVVIGELSGRVIWLLGVLFVIKLKFSLLAIMGAVALSNFFNFLIVFLLAQKYIKIRLAFDFAEWKRIMKIAAPLAFSVVFTLVHFKVGIVLLSLFKPAKDVGIYGAPLKILENLVTFAAIFAGLLLPLLSKYAQINREKFKEIYREGFNVLSIFVVPLILGTLILAKPVMVFFGGLEFEASAQVLKILIFATGIIYFTHLFGNSLVALGQQKKMMWVYLVAALAAIVLNLIFIPKFTYFAPASINVITEAFVSLACTFIVFKSARVIPSFIVLLKSLVSALVMVGIIYLLPSFHVLITVALGALSYFIVLFLLRGFSWQTILEIIRFRE